MEDPTIDDILNTHTHTEREREGTRISLFLPKGFWDPRIVCLKHHCPQHEVLPFSVTHKRVCPACPYCGSHRSWLIYSDTTTSQRCKGLCFSEIFLYFILLELPSMSWVYHMRNTGQFSLVTQPCSTLCDPVDCSMLGLHVHHQLLELTQTHVHRVGDAIQPFHPLSFPSPAFSLSQH